MVEADGLSVAALVAGVRGGRTVVKLQGPSDPMIELTSPALSTGDTARGANVTLLARVTGGAGLELRFVRDGEPLEPQAIDSDPFEATIAAAAPATGETRIRAEVLVLGKPRTVTSHVWVRNADPASGSGGAAAASPAGGCDCRLVPSGSVLGFAPSLAMALALCRKRRRKPFC